MTNPKKTYSDEYKANRRKNQLLWLEKKRQDPEWVKEQSERKKAYRNKGKQPMTSIVPEIDPTDDIIARINEDKKRINDLRFFMSIQNMPPAYATRGMRALVKECVTEGYPLSAEFAELVLAQDYVAMARMFGYQLKIKVTPRNGDPVWMGPIMYKGALYSHVGDIRPNSTLPKIIEAAQLKERTINTSKKTITGGNK